MPRLSFSLQSIAGRDMPFYENPPERERTLTDRLGQAPVILWAALAVLAVAGFVVLLVLAHHNGG
jgi:hypothetical protein